MAAQSDESNRYDPEQTGAAWAEAGLTSQHDYSQLNRLTQAILKGSVLADADREWLIALLETTTEPIVRSKVMVMLAADQTSLSPKARARVEAVLARTQNSENVLDQKSAAHLQQALDARNDGMGGASP